MSSSQNPAAARTQQQPPEVGKLPLALQQLGLAVQRADEAGNKALSKKIQQKMAELIQEINV
jgi:hypothetical protein